MPEPRRTTVDVARQHIDDWLEVMRRVGAQPPPGMESRSAELDQQWGERPTDVFVLRPISE
jgi:hypothetical protein